MAGLTHILAEGLTFPEAPRWHAGALWFSDFYSHRVLRLSPDGTLETVCTVPAQPSGLGFLPDGRLLVVSMLDRTVRRLEPTGLVLHADLSALAGGPANDMLVGRDGAAYVGNFGFDRAAGEPARPASLALVRPDGSAIAVAADLAFPNGMARTADGRLVVAETHANRLTAFRIADDDTLTDRHVFADLGAISPDGICLDAEGAVWVAHPQGSALHRVAEGGSVLDTIALDRPGSFACALGGADGRDLFICTNDTSRLGPGRDPRAGRIERVRVEVPGA